MSNRLLMHKSNLSSILFFLFCVSALVLLCCPSVLFAGVGGGVEGKPADQIHISDLITWTLVFLAGLGSVFGLGIAFAAKRFAVQIDPRVEKGQRPACARALRCVRLCRLRTVRRGGGK